MISFNRSANRIGSIQSCKNLSNLPFGLVRGVSKFYTYAFDFIYRDGMNNKSFNVPAR